MRVQKNRFAKYQSVTTNEIIQKVANYALGINTMKSRRNSKLDVDDFQRFSATPIKAAMFSLSRKKPSYLLFLLTVVVY